jgi:hypothetical protein
VKTTLLRVSLFSLLFVAAGCFQYVPPGNITPTRATPIRLYLEQPSSFELTNLIVTNVIRVDGELVRRDGGDVILSATWLDTPGGVGFDGEGWTLRIPESNISVFELKRMSWWRTGAVLLGGGLLTIFGFDTLGAGSEGSGGGGGGGQAL